MPMRVREIQIVIMFRLLSYARYISSLRICSKRVSFSWRMHCINLKVWVYIIFTAYIHAVQYTLYQSWYVCTYVPLPVDMEDLLSKNLRAGCGVGM